MLFDRANADSKGNNPESLGFPHRNGHSSRMNKDSVGVVRGEANQLIHEVDCILPNSGEPATPTDTCIYADVHEVFYLNERMPKVDW
jgi:hypothetical protein